MATLFRRSTVLWLVLLSMRLEPAIADARPLPVPAAVLTRVAFGSCAFQSVEQPIFRAVVAEGPDLYLSLGDAIYADYDLATKAAYPVTPDSLRREWRVLADNPDWRYLVERVPVMATWDNHDYGHHSAGAEFPLKNVSAEIFLDFFGEPANSARRERPGIYDARIFGPPGKRLQIILLDTRSFKSPPRLASRSEGEGGSLGKYLPDPDPSATLLGNDQWQWLEAQLREPADLRLVASSGQVIPDEKGMDEWGNYPLERQRLLDLVAAQKSGKVILLSGNVHFAELSALESAGQMLVEITSSGLTHVNKAYAKAPNRYRVAGPFMGRNFGLVEIDWQAGPAITLKAIDAAGKVAFEYSLH